MIACFKQPRTSSLMLVKINTQAYEVIVCEPCPSPTPSRGWLANGSSISHARLFLLKTAQCLSSYIDIDVSLGSASEESLVEERKHIGLSSIQETHIRHLSIESICSAIEQSSRALVLVKETLALCSGRHSRVYLNTRKLTRCQC